MNARHGPRLCLLCAVGCVLVVSGCASAPGAFTPPTTVWTKTAPAVTLNGSYERVQRGDTLWRIAKAYGLEPQALAAANQIRSHQALEIGQRLFVPLPPESSRFLWPVRGAWRGTRRASWIELTPPPQSLIRASRSGQVSVAARRVSGFGKMIVLDHLDGCVSVYAGLGELLVSPGMFVKQGMPIAGAGGSRVRFEIRRGIKPLEALALLPQL